MAKPKRSKRHLEFSTILPWQFYLLCKLVNTDPQKVIYDFLCNASMESYGLGEVERAKAVEYFLACGYGQQYYTPEDIRSILKELESIGSLFPNNGSPKLIDLHAQWRKKYYRYWFKKWYEKVRRKS